MRESIRSQIDLLRETAKLLRKQFRQYPPIFLFTPIISIILTYWFYLLIASITASATSHDRDFLSIIMFWMVTLLSVQLFANILLEQIIEEEFDPQAARLDVFGRAKGLRDVGRRTLAIVLGVVVVVLSAQFKLYAQYQALIIGLILVLNALLVLAAPITLYSRAIDGKPIVAKTPQGLQLWLANVKQLGSVFAWRMIGLLILIPYDWLVTELIFSGLELIIETDNGFLLFIFPLLLVPILSLFILALLFQVFYGLLEHLRFIQLSDQANDSNKLSRRKVHLATHSEPQTSQHIQAQHP